MNRILFYELLNLPKLLEDLTTIYSDGKNMMINNSHIVYNIHKLITF